MGLVRGLIPFILRHDILGCRKWPAVKGINTLNCGILAYSSVVALYGIFYVPLERSTAWMTVGYFLFSIFGVTAGYHRLWSHRSYRAAFPLRLGLLCAGSSAVQGSCLYWVRLHRAHHRYTDTDKDPYNSNHGLFWAHMGWMMFRTDCRRGPVDVSDLRADPLVSWQHRNYLWSALVFGYILPAVFPGLLWGDWWGGVCYVCALRMTLSHHSVFCINSIAHYMGDKTYDDHHTPCDNLATGILTMGEGYHNFHHQFPMDYRSAFYWYQYDPTKWFIAGLEFVGLTRHLQRFPINEVRKVALSMKIKVLQKEHGTIDWPVEKVDLPVVPWEVFKQESSSRTLILVAGFIHDVSDFLDSHPGGAALLVTNSGKDMTSAFFGGVYNHSNAAHNLLTMKRVAILAGGVELVEESKHANAPRQMYIAEKNMY